MHQTVKAMKFASIHLNACSDGYQNLNLVKIKKIIYWSYAEFKTYLASIMSMKTQFAEPETCRQLKKEGKNWSRILFGTQNASLL